MAAVELEELRKRKRDQILRLMEVSDLTKQLSDAINRNDQTSVQLLLSMRQEPLLQLQELETGIRSYLLTLPQDSAIRCSDLLRGAAAASPEEEGLCEQVAKFRRLLDPLVAEDKRLSLRLGGSQSFYHMFRD